LELTGGVFRPVPRLHVLTVIKMQQICHAANKMFFVLVDTPVRQGDPPDTLQQGLFLGLIKVVVDLPGKFIKRRRIFGMRQGIFQNLFCLFPGHLVGLNCAVHNGFQFSFIFVAVYPGQLHHQCGCSNRKLVSIGGYRLGCRYCKEFFQVFNHIPTTVDSRKSQAAWASWRTRFSSSIWSAANRRMPSASFSVAMASSLDSHRNSFSSMAPIFSLLDAVSALSRRASSP